MEKLKNLWINFGKDSNQDKILLGSFALSLAAVTLVQISRTQSAAPEIPTPATSVDTFIPAGQVLVPVDVSNASALEGVFDSYGVVDLYAVREGGPPETRPLAQNVKMLRAPLDRNQFAVLVPESQSSRLASHPGAFVVVLHNRSQSGPKFETSRKRKLPKAVIEYEEPL